MATEATLTPLADMALIICEELPAIPLVDACKIAVALQMEGYCKAPF